MSKEFAHNLKNARIATGMKQKEVAELIGMSASTYSQYESGTREPSIGVIKRILVALGVSANDLMTEEDVGKESIVFRNLDAEQARWGMTNAATGDLIGVSRVVFENKKKSGRITVLEAQKLCEYFHCDFDYLFKVYDIATVKS